LNEFELIQRFFEHQSIHRDEVHLGIGDDAALLRTPPGLEQVIATDMLIAGRHFPEDTEAVSVGHKALAVNISDLAAMGATPACFTLSLSLPEVNEAWLAGFCSGMFALAAEYRMALIGGDTVRGPLTVCVQVIGWIPPGQALLRSGAGPGDKIYLTGEVGDAGLALLHGQGRLNFTPPELEKVLPRLNRPTPRVQEGIALRGIAGSCIDVSDGLLADLGHILAASRVGARLALGDIPVSDLYRTCFGRIGGWDIALTHGDDYELCFTVPAEKRGALAEVSSKASCAITCIGEIQSQPGLRIFDPEGNRYETTKAGHDHFRS
jgi:thiamine-monophosphate kinase